VLEASDLVGLQQRHDRGILAANLESKTIAVILGADVHLNLPAVAVE
jgi:hypothetical protein